MDYRKFGECYYIRMDRNDEIISTIRKYAKKKTSDQPLFQDRRM